MRGKKGGRLYTALSLRFAAPRFASIPDLKVLALRVEPPSGRADAWRAADKTPKEGIAAVALAGGLHASSLTVLALPRNAVATAGLLALAAAAHPSRGPSRRSPRRPAAQT